jgi:hypothetical protein
MQNLGPFCIKNLENWEKERLWACRSSSEMLLMLSTGRKVKGSRYCDFAVFSYFILFMKQLSLLFAFVLPENSHWGLLINFRLFYQSKRFQFSKAKAKNSTIWIKMLFSLKVRFSLNWNFDDSNGAF